MNTISGKLKIVLKCINNIIDDFYVDKYNKHSYLAFYKQGTKLSMVALSEVYTN